MIQAIMAHIVASITVFVNAPLISAAKVRHCKRKDCPDALSFAARMAANRSCVFLASSCLTPNKGDLLYLIRNKVDY